MNRDHFTLAPDDVREIRHFHLFCGLGGGAKGFNKASPRVGNMVGKMRCIGGIDVNAPAIRDFERFAGVRGTVLDLFDRDQFTAFHGKEPPAGWREAGPAEAAEAIGLVMGTTILLAMSGETFVLSSTPIWVRPMAVALSVAQSAEAGGCNG